MTGYPLEPSGDDMRAMVDRAMARIVEHVESLPEQNASYDEADGPVTARSLVESAPESGTAFPELLQLLFDRAVPVSYNTAAPGYLAYVPGGGLFHSAVADLIANAVNRYVGVWFAAPGLVQLEVNVIRWFCEIVGYPPEAGGVLTPGGSLANLIAVITARRERLPDDFLGGTLYTGDQTHHSVQKAAVLAGFPPGNVRVIPSDAQYRLRTDRLERAVAEDRAAGRTPFLVVASAGTTNTGAVDDLEGVATIAAREHLWFHADAAYGGFFALTERGRHRLRGLERADSLALDPHKGLFLPYGLGSILVRDPETLRRAHSTFADYMPPMQDERDLVDFCQISPELSRDFRGLRAWLPLKMLGLAPFREALDEKLDLTVYAADELRRMEDIEILAEPQLSVVAFRLRRGTADDLNELNRRFLRGINARGRVYLTGTVLDGNFAIRICVLSFRTHRERIDLCLEDIRAAAADMLASVP